MDARPHSRPQSDTRLDLITIMLRGRKSRKTTKLEKIAESQSRCDSLSPMDHQNTKVAMNSTMYPPRTSSRSNREPSRVVPSPAQPQPSRSTETSSPRSVHRPASIEVKQSNGCTALTTAELKQRICDSKRNDAKTTITQVPIDKRDWPPTPTTPFNLATMGNKTSSLAASTATEDPPPNKNLRSSKPVSRKSSFNVFKRVDSRSPLPRDVTASVMSVMHLDSHQRNTSTVHDDDDSEDAAVTVVAQSVFDRPGKYDSRYPRVSHVHSVSTTTMTEDKASQPLSASTTIRDFRSVGNYQSNVDDQVRDRNDKQPKPSLHNTGLSPTLPAPSPLPEDSPHKYGLRDKMETPELPAKAIIIPKARRKSSGLEIFNEAKSLQSAASFLNGLSTSRRRAESAADTSTSSWTALNAPSRPSSTRPSSTRRSSGYQDGEGRRNNHNFKSSGFAYTRPLTLVQIKCFRGHARLLLSKNKNAPVECAVCHIDDDGDHFSCSWCAIRMCRYCRKDFAERGMSALRERIKTAELGSSSSENSSNESLLHHGRGTSDRSLLQIAY